MAQWKAPIGCKAKHLGVCDNDVNHIFECDCVTRLIAVYKGEDFICIEEAHRLNLIDGPPSKTSKPS
jgi:hypothetical protein